MKIFSLTLAFTAILLVHCSDSSLREAEGQPKSGQPGLQPLVVPGEDAIWADFPATCRFRPAGAGQPCSCVIVGAQAMMTAAHCVGPLSRGDVQLENTEHAANCTANSSLDLALCRLTTSVSVPFETLDTQQGSLSTGGALLLTGFGCDGNGNSDRLKKGLASIASLPASDNFIALGTGSYLCEGDSGGPTYRLLDGSNAHTGRRLVAGINASDFHLSSVATPAARAFTSGWATTNRTSICGITPGAAGCRPL